MVDVDTFFSSSIIVSDDFEIFGMCYTSHPCQHHVKINGVTDSKLWGAIEIYQYLINNNLPVPEHFVYCKDICEKRKVIKFIEQNDLENFKKTYLLNNGNKIQEFMNSACKFGSLDIIDHLLQNFEINITLDHFRECLQNADNELCLLTFKHLLNYFDGDITGKIKTGYSWYEGDTLLLIAARCGQAKVITYLLQEFNFQLGKSLIKYLSSLEKKNTKIIQEEINVNGWIISRPIKETVDNNTIDPTVRNMIDYLTDKSIQDKIIFHEHDISPLKEYDLYDTMLQNGLIYNSDAICTVVEEIMYGLDAADALFYDYYKLGLAKIINEEEIKIMCHKNLADNCNYIKLYKTHDVKKIVVNLELSQDVPIELYMRFNNNDRLDFKKMYNSDTKYFIEFQDPFRMRFITFTNTDIAIKIKDKLDDIHIKNIDIYVLGYVDKQTDEMNTELVRFNVDENTICEQQSGALRFVKNI